LGASNGFDQQSMIALALSRILELGATVMEEWLRTRPEPRWRDGCRGWFWIRSCNPKTRNIQLWLQRPQERV
jgi:hypothetical protein